MGQSASQCSGEVCVHACMCVQGPNQPMVYKRILKLETIKFTYLLGVCMYMHTHGTMLPPHTCALHAHLKLSRPHCDSLSL